MSRIQDILSKAERDGTARRTRALADDGPCRRRDGDSGAAARRTAPALRAAGAPCAARGRRAGSGRRSRRSPRRSPAGTLDVHLGRGARAAVAGGRAVPVAAHPHQARRERPRGPRHRRHQPEQRRRQEPDRREPRHHDGAGVPAARAARRRRPPPARRVHRLFGIPDGPGLSDVLMGAADLNQALVDAAGASPDAAARRAALPSHPAELLGSAAMRRVLDTLRTRFDRILIDMPPVAPLADLHIVAPMADGLLMIVRAGVTPKPAIERALSGLDIVEGARPRAERSRAATGARSLDLRGLRLHRGLRTDEAIGSPDGSCSCSIGTSRRAASRSSAASCC